MRAVLLITETADLAADLLVLRAAERGIPLYRLNLDEFPGRVTVGWSPSGGADINYDGQRFGDADVAGAWFRRMPRPLEAADETGRFIDRERDAFVTGLLETAPWIWMNAPAAARRAEHKLLQLREARRAGFSIPETVAGNDPELARKLASKGAIVAKAVAGGRLTIGGLGHAVFTSAVDASDLRDADAVRACPMLFQQRVETAYDLRITVVRHQVFAARITTAGRVSSDLDWRQADPNRICYEPCTLPNALAGRCIAFVAQLGLLYAALDFVVANDGGHWFLEANPAGQWGWIERATGLPITDAMLWALQGQS